MNIKDITITSLETITAFDVVTGNYKFTLDELQNATIANTQDSTEITGKGGRTGANVKRTSWHRKSDINDQWCIARRTDSRSGRSGA